VKKNYENWSTFTEVIAKQKWSTFVRHRVVFSFATLYVDFLNNIELL